MLLKIIKVKILFTMLLKNIADPDLSPLSSSTYTSSTPSPSNLNSLGEYVPIVPSVQERIDNLIQRHIDVG